MKTLTSRPATPTSALLPIRPISLISPIVRATPEILP